MRTKRKNYFCMLLVAAQVWMLATCSDEHDWHPPGNDIPAGAISVEEAQAFFEEQMMRMETVANTGELRGFATNFTPQWDGAVISGRDSMVSVDVPIVTDYLFKAVVLANETSETDKFTEDLLQKLIVVKDLRTGNLGSYVVSIIPDKAYAESRKKVSAMDFPNYGDYGNFSGRIVYTFPLSPVPLRINHYREGVRINAFSVFGLSKNSPELQDAGAMVKNLLNGLWLKRKSRVALRAYELDGGWLDEVVVNGDSGGDNFDWNAFWNGFWDDWDKNNPQPNPNPNPPDPGVGGGGGTSSTPQTRTDCPSSAAANSTATNAILNKTNGNTAVQVKANIDLLRNYAKTKSNEYGVAVDYSNSQYTVRNQSIDPNNPLYIREGTNNVVQCTYSSNTYLIAHSHPSGGYAAPSPADAIGVAQAYSGRLSSTQNVAAKAQNIQGSVILAHDGSEYMIYVNNRSQLSAFCNNPINNSFFDSNEAFFKQGSIFDSQYNTVRTNLLNRGYSGNDAQSYALSYVLDYYNTGLKISKKSPGKTDFKEQKTDVATVGTSLNYTPKICQ